RWQQSFDAPGPMSTNFSRVECRMFHRSHTSAWAVKSSYDERHWRDGSLKLRITVRVLHWAPNPISTPWTHERRFDSCVDGFRKAASRSGTVLGLGNGGKTDIGEMLFSAASHK